MNCDRIIYLLSQQRKRTFTSPGPWPPYTFEIHQDTPRIHVFYRIHSRYIRIHQDTYRIGNYTKSYRKLHRSPGTDRWGPPPQSEHRRQSISSPRSLRFVAWSSAAPLAGGPGRSASSLLRLRRYCVVVSPASVALAWRPLHMLDARSFMISTLRSQVGFAAAVAHARLRLSRLEPDLRVWCSFLRKSV